LREASVHHRSRRTALAALAVLLAFLPALASAQAPNGREVWAHAGVALHAGANTVAVDAGALPAGVYWLDAATGDGASAVRKVVLLGR